MPTQFFGFEDQFGGPTPNVEKLADEAVPGFGGVFKSQGQAASSNFALSDTEYRRLLLAKAYLLSSEVISFDTCYHAISTLFGRTPKDMAINVVGPRQLELVLSSTDTTRADDSLITYFGQYLFPLGTSFSVTRI